MANICEYLREKSVEELFQMSSFFKGWSTWEVIIKKQLSPLNSTNFMDLGDQLSNIFKTTGVAGRGQGELSSSGSAWEALVCWYLNLGLIESRTVVIKYKKKFIPAPIHDALTVRYGNFSSTTESDLIAITFPDKPDYTHDKYLIEIKDKKGSIIPTSDKNGHFNYLPIVDTLLTRDFTDIELGVIQCKTNWNDNAQIPMLWDMIYQSNGFQNSIKVGKGGFSIKDIEKFTYSFVTVPSNDKTKINSNSTSVKRVANITGGNYWGHPTVDSVASSLNEIFNINFQSSSNSSLHNRLNTAFEHISTKFKYFNIG